ncbi:MAG: hypothetical protein Salg2KO_14710 [Salibacteraceae bacterium]
MKISITLITALGVAAMSCKKITQTNTSIQGKVINQTDYSPLVGYEVRLVETETPAESFTPLIKKTLGISTTNASGEFDFGAVELYRPSRYSYTVEFDDNDENFATQSWQHGDYEEVTTSAKIEKGEDNYLVMKQVSFGDLRVTISNQSTYERLAFNLILRNDKSENQSGYLEVIKNNERKTASATTFASGNAEVVYLISDVNSSFSDTALQTVFIVPYQSNTLRFEYSN